MFLSRNRPLEWSRQIHQYFGFSLLYDPHAESCKFSPSSLLSISFRCCLELKFIFSCTLAIFTFSLKCSPQKRWLLVCYVANLIYNKFNWTRFFFFFVSFLWAAGCPMSFLLNANKIFLEISLSPFLNSFINETKNTKHTPRGHLDSLLSIILFCGLVNLYF